MTFLLIEIQLMARPIIMVMREADKGCEQNYLQSELNPLGIDWKRMNEFNCKEELEALANAIKKFIFKITRLLTAKIQAIV